MRPPFLDAIDEHADLKGGMQKRSNPRAIIAAALAIDNDVLVALVEMYGVGAGIVPRLQDPLHHRQSSCASLVREVEIYVDAVGAASVARSRP